MKYIDISFEILDNEPNLFSFLRSSINLVDFKNNLKLDFTRFIFESEYFKESGKYIVLKRKNGLFEIVKE